MEIELIDNAHNFYQMGESWNNTLTRSPAKLPFLSHEWLTSWWKTYGHDKKLFILTAKAQDSATPQAIAPLMITKELFFRSVQFIGTRQSDYLDFIVAENFEESLPAFFNFLKQKQNLWDMMLLKDIQPYNNNLANIAKLAAAQGFKVRLIKSSLYPFIVINSEWEEFLASKSSNFRYTLKRNEKKIIDDNFQFQTQKLNYDPLTRDLTDIIEIEKHSWKFKRGAFKIQTEQQKLFYSNFLSEFSKSGWLNLWFLEINKQPAAYQINFDYDNKIWFYNSAYDKRFKKYSPGSILMHHTIRDAFLNGKREYDFMRGEEKFKGRWTKEKRLSYQICIFKPTLRSIMAYIALSKLGKYVAALKKLSKLGYS